MTVQKSTINKYKSQLIVGVCIIALLSLLNCNNNKYQQLRGEYEVLKEDYKIKKDDLIIAETSRLRVKDSIRLEDAKKEATIKHLSEVAQKSRDRIKALEALNIDKKKQIKSLTLDGVAKELNENYGGSNATAKEKSIDISGSLPYQVLETIADANTAQDIIKEKNVQLSSKDSIISVKSSQLRDSRVNLFSTEKQIDHHKILEETADKNIKNLENQNKKLRVKSTISKVLIPVAFGLGYLIVK